MTRRGSCTASIWAWAGASEHLPQASGSELDFYTGKLHGCQYFFRYELPRIDPVLKLLRALYLGKANFLN